jgi:dipeptidyl aminopeptidase/acylaminoacyl peptidase
MRHRPLSVLLLALALPGAQARETQPVADGFETRAWKDTLWSIMRDPDWIGPPVEAPFWALDGSALHFSLKRAGSPVRDLYLVGLDGSAAEKVDDAQRAGIDAPAPVFDASGQRALLVRDGDIFLRDRAANRLQALTRTPEAESDPQFGADGTSVYWRSNTRWYRHDLATAISGPLAEIKAEKDPAAAKPDELAAMQLRLISTLAREKAQREALAAREKQRRQSDPTLPPLPVFLGLDARLAETRLSPDGRWLIAVTEPKNEAGRGGKMPKYVTESGYEEAEDVRTRVGRNLPHAQALHLVDLADGSVRALDLAVLPGISDDPLAALRKAADKPKLEGPRALRVMGVRWNAAGDRVALMLRANDNKDRWIATVDLAKGALQPRHRLSDPGWINWNFNEFGWLADGQTLWFLSEQTGYTHLYVQEDAAKAKAVALTSGRWEASDVVWQRDGARAYFLCNREWPGDYEVCSVGRDGGAVREHTALDGVEAFVLAPDEDRLGVLHSAHHTPPQLSVVSLADGATRALTDTRSTEYKAREASWLAPQIVQIPSKHGAGTVWGKFYGPAQREPGKRYPIALFVHGAGYLQNVHARWPVYFREQMFNELLVQHGYVVLDLDYRGSEGYGRDWRTAIYRQMGHPELEDYLDGIDWLVETQQGDRERVGIYGGSYGGFMAFMALFRAPDAFHAGAALRPVTDWTMYNHGYTSNILNTPDLDPEAYAKSSPIEYADNLRGQLLIAHGMIDDNVFYQDSVRLAQRLIELRKDGWELASYPLERHGYVHPESWYDQYRRIFELFERTLQR